MYVCATSWYMDISHMNSVYDTILNLFHVNLFAHNIYFDQYSILFKKVHSIDPILSKPIYTKIQT